MVEFIKLSHIGKIRSKDIIMVNKQITKQLMSDAQMHHAEQMAKKEKLNIQAKVIESNDNGWKDEICLGFVLCYSFIGLVCFL